MTLRSSFLFALVVAGGVAFAISPINCIGADQARPNVSLRSGSEADGSALSRVSLPEHAGGDALASNALSY